MKRSIRFGISKRTESENVVPIRARISIGGDRINIHIGYSIRACDWDNISQRVKSGTKSAHGETANEINRAISNCITEFDDFFLRAEVLKKQTPSKSEIKMFMRAVLGLPEDLKNEPKVTFNRCYLEFTSTMGNLNNWTHSTHQKFTTLKVHLDRYNPNLSFEQIDDNTLQGFVNSMYDEGLRNTTIAKMLSFLRWFLRWAHNNDYYTGKAHNTFKPKLKGTNGNTKEVIYLEWEELLSLVDFDFEKEKLSRVRDVFCFCCFTGLRYSDVAKLRKMDVRDNAIHVVTQKTSEKLIIELNSHARKILARYSNKRILGDLALPVISNQRTNDALKEIGRIAGLDTPQRIVYFVKNKRIEEVYPKYELLTTHCARRTFIVNALRLGIPAEVIMKWTGHSDYKSMKPYVKIVDQLKVSEMAKFDITTPETTPENGKINNN